MKAAACLSEQLLPSPLSALWVPQPSGPRGDCARPRPALAAAGDSAMGRHGACPPGCLLDEITFNENFMNQKRARKTYLCYEVEILDGDARVPLDENKGFVRNKGANQPGKRCHAELYFLDRIHSWNLDRGQHYRLTCFISWTPCHNCAQKLATFLGENSHVSLHIFASRIHSFPGYEAGLLTLQEAGAQIAIMTSKEFEHCWETFVDHQGRPFQPWDGLEEESQHLCKKLQAILPLQNKDHVTEALCRAKFKFPGRQKIHISKEWGFTKFNANEFENMVAEKQLIPDGCGVKYIPNRGSLDK
ncbi:DNA dC-_dU-editing enzyme APOBEC-3A [Mesoplodon densirostris]|uniref:DNA dC->dU-editing enzyme APOBEC-3A n=1 Tax=Mesoplodon densirostris TaxID=48708 RepID=UPI0028DC4A0C|nr:DNA dC->dU-editing enzyme APOBEC-3A [Mesoplodon densirostris]